MSSGTSFFTSSSCVLRVAYVCLAWYERDSHALGNSSLLKHNVDYFLFGLILIYFCLFSLLYFLWIRTPISLEFFQIFVLIFVIASRYPYSLSGIRERVLGDLSFSSDDPSADCFVLRGLLPWLRLKGGYLEQTSAQWLRTISQCFTVTEYIALDKPRGTVGELWYI